MSDQNRPVFQSVEAVQAQFAQRNYIAGRALALSVKLAADLEKPLLLEGEAGVGKTEVAKVLAGVLDTPLIRLQCYEGLDAQTTLYEWNYARQILHIRMAEQQPQERPLLERTIFGDEFLLNRPLLEAIRHPGPRPVVLLIDEVDRVTIISPPFYQRSDNTLPVLPIDSIRNKDRSVSPGTRCNIPPVSHIDDYPTHHPWFAERQGVPCVPPTELQTCEELVAAWNRVGQIRRTPASILQAPWRGDHPDRPGERIESNLRVLFRALEITLLNPQAHTPGTALEKIDIIRSDINSGDSVCTYGDEQTEPYLTGESGYGGQLSSTVCRAGPTPRDPAPDVLHDSLER